MNNEFSYTHSKAMLLRTCPAQFYYHYYKSWNGWYKKSQPPKDERAGMAYRAKHLETKNGWFGKLAHNAAADALAGASTGAVTPHNVFQRMKDHVMQAIDRGLRQAVVEEPITDPKRTLRFIGPIPSKEETVAHTIPLLEALSTDDEWTGVPPKNPLLLAIANHRRIVLVDEIRFFWYKGIKVWVAPDLVMHSAQRPGHVWVVDWKAGREKAEHNQQLDAYGAWAKSMNYGGSVGCLAYLQERENIKVEPSQSSFDDDVRLFVEEMRPRLVDGDIGRNIPIEESFKPSPGARCRFCPQIASCKLDHPNLNR